MQLHRTNLIMEFGPYGPSGFGGNNTVSGFAAPVGVRNFGTWPLIPNIEVWRQKEAEGARRRDRLRQLALGWFINTGAMPAAGSVVNPGAGAAGASNGSSSGAAPGSIF